MFTKLQTIEELKEIYIEILLNKTNKVTKVSDGSSNNAIAFGAAKLAQKTIKDIAILEAHIFPDSAFGIYIDDYGRLNGTGERFGVRQSSTYVRVVGDPGTTYFPGTNVFVSTTGVNFDIERTYTIGDFGYGYIKVRSQTGGEVTKVDAFSINTVTNPPDGHQYCINEYIAQYGQDSESDDTLRRRVKEGANSLARGTLALLEQIFMKINEAVLKVFYTGRDSIGRPIISIVTVNGIDLLDSELNDILLRGEKFLTTTEMRSVDGSGAINLVIQNAIWQPIDISFRVELESSYDPNDVRKEIQIRLSKYLDYRYWKVGQRVEWDNMLEIVKSTEGVRYVNDNFFYPRTDILIDTNKLPRIRGFQMLDTNGNIIQDFQGNLNPIFYPNEIDFSFAATILKTI